MRLAWILGAALALAAPPVRCEPLALDLAQALERARANSPHLERLRALEAAAGAQVRGARAERMPVVEISAGYARHSDVPEFVAGIPPEVVFPNIPDRYDSRLGVSLPLYTGGRIRSATEAAGAAREAAAADVEAADADLLLETAEAYWSLVDAIESERVLAEALASYEAHLQEATARADVGLAARNEVLAVQVERDEAAQTRVEATRVRRSANANLVRLAGLEPEAEVLPTEPLEVVVDDESIEDLVRAALASRPERAALAARVAAAEARVTTERSARRPRVSASGAYDLANPNPGIVPPRAEWDTTWELGAHLTFTIFEGGRISAAVGAAQAEAIAAHRALDELERGIRLEATTAVLDVRAAREAVSVADTRLAAARENVRVSGDRYREGVVPSSELLDAETGLLRGSLARTRSLTRLRISIARVDHAAGRTP